MVGESSAIVAVVRGSIEGVTGAGAGALKGVLASVADDFSASCAKASGGALQNNSAANSERSFRIQMSGEEPVEKSLAALRANGLKVNQQITQLRR